MLNGGRSKKLGDIPVIFSTQTCAFDSIFQLIAVCHADSPQFKDVVDKSNTYFAEFLRLTMSGDTKQNDRIDAMRNKILTDLFPERVQHVKGMQTIDCETVIDDAFRRICNEFKELNSFNICLGCCEYLSDSPFLQFRLKNLNVRNLQTAIIKPNQRKRCQYCKILSETYIMEHEILTFDICGNIRNEELENIQRHIEFEGKHYQLLGIVEHDSRRKHFLAHALRSNNEWKTYDDLDNRRKTPTTIEAIALILYRNLTPTVML